MYMNQRKKFWISIYRVKSNFYMPKIFSSWPLQYIQGKTLQGIQWKNK